MSLQAVFGREFDACGAEMYSGSIVNSLERRRVSNRRLSRSKRTMLAASVGEAAMKTACPGPRERLRSL